VDFFASVCVLSGFRPFLLLLVETEYPSSFQSKSPAANNGGHSQGSVVQAQKCEGGCVLALVFNGLFPIVWRCLVSLTLFESEYSELIPNSSATNSIIQIQIQS
jgi:hypothetical protein